MDAICGQDPWSKPLVEVTGRPVSFSRAHAALSLAREFPAQAARRPLAGIVDFTALMTADMSAYATVRKAMRANQAHYE